MEDKKPKVGKKRKATGDSGKSRKKAKTDESYEWNPLDATAIHPESYQVAEK